ncbi:trypsin-like peptidase domain-containing protein [Actinoplanes sp. HUAS TT8]|uniref:trypsin-like peptidase domain-containing protein n=1 Tax=Actinoplanes sp. HUAS TT8 TaxID=3447453 RepID=UPI003F51C835
MNPAPGNASWTVAIHTGERSTTAIGTGVVVGPSLVLTCAHVACLAGKLRPDLWISFPKSGEGFWVRRRVARCRADGMPRHEIDLALLELTEPVPARVRPARLRCLPEHALLQRSWWAFGFPNGSGDGSTAHGRVTEGLSWGKIQLTNESDAGLAKGFSGAALWSPDYEAVVGIVEQHNDKGHGRALTFRYVDEHLPAIGLSAMSRWRAGDADDAALAAWGWTLTTDAEAGQHWLPRARGVAVRSERGFRFRGREAALLGIKQWLDRPTAAGRPLVLTGSPGVGKSAVLGRIVTTADPEIGAGLPADDTAVRATTGSVSCAIHAKGKTALDVAIEIAKATGARLPQAPDELPSALRDHLAGRAVRFNLIVDALDEAATPQQARLLLSTVLLPLARTCAGVGVQVAVGTRRGDDLGSLLDLFGAAPERHVIDLDEPAYFAESDLVEYARATLQLVGDERPGNPYAEISVALPVARRIAALARANFLVAGLLARTRARNDTVALDPSQVQFAGGVGAAMDSYVDTLSPAGSASARCALTVLAYAETPGLPLSLWRAGVRALGAEVSEAELAAFARTSAANFLVETSGAREINYRLFHQALNDELRAAREDPGRDESHLVDAWIGAGSTTGWTRAPDYLLTNLAEHAARTGRLDRLLCDDGYLLHARLDRVVRVASLAHGVRARARTQLLQLAPAAIGAAPADRAALFSVADTLDRLDCDINPDTTGDVPYRALWAHTLPRQERTLLEGHAEAVFDVCPVTVDGRTLLASGDDDGTVRLWDPRTNQSEQDWQCHQDGVRGICSVRAGTSELLATASLDGTIRLWDPLTRILVRELREHGEWVRNICTIPLPDRDLLASAGDDGTVRIWEPATGTMLHILDDHAGWVTAVTHVPSGGRDLLASAGYDGTVRLWDPLTGAPLAKMTGHDGWVTTLHALRLSPGRALVASAGYDGTVRLWDPETDEEVGRFDTGGPLTDLCTLDTQGRRLLAATGEDGTIRLWDSADWSEREPLTGHSSWIRAVCELPTDDGPVLATAGDDGTVRLWDADAPRRGPIADARQLKAVTSLCIVPGEDGPMVASAGGDDGIRLWDPLTGEQRCELRAESGTVTSLCVADDEGTVVIAAGNSSGAVELWDDLSAPPGEPMHEHYDSVSAVCVIREDNQELIASAGDDQIVRLWTLHDRVVRSRLANQSEWVTALTVVSRKGRVALAAADTAGTVRLWDPSGALHWASPGRSLMAVNALCPVTVNGRDLLVSAGADRTITLWDPESGRPEMTLLGHERDVTGVCPMLYAGRDVIVSTSLDRTVRLWDPTTGRLIRIIQVYHPALSCLAVDDTLIVGLDHGLLALRITRPGVV